MRSDNFFNNPVFCISYSSDILSFYKEELAGETVNRISQLAVCRKISKERALNSLVSGAAGSHKRVFEILATHPGAHKAYASFSQGYIGFHAGLRRYKLDELHLADVGRGLPSAKYERRYVVFVFLTLSSVTILLAFCVFSSHSYTQFVKVPTDVFGIEPGLLPFPDVY